MAHSKFPAVLTKINAAAGPPEWMPSNVSNFILWWFNCYFCLRKATRLNWTILTAILNLLAFPLLAFFFWQILQPFHLFSIFSFIFWHVFPIKNIFVYIWSKYIDLKLQLAKYIRVFLTALWKARTSALSSCFDES